MASVRRADCLNRVIHTGVARSFTSSTTLSSIDSPSADTPFVTVDEVAFRTGEPSLKISHNRLWRGSSDKKESRPANGADEDMDAPDSDLQPTVLSVLPIELRLVVLGYC